MERTISRIKNLKTKRKLSLPASPSPGIFANGTISGKQPEFWSQAKPDHLSIPYSRIRSLSPDDAFVKKGQQLRNSPETEEADDEFFEAESVMSNLSGNFPPSVKRNLTHRTVSERHRKVQWSPDVRKSRMEIPDQRNAGPRYKRSDSVSTVEEESLKVRNKHRHGSLPHVFRNFQIHGASNHHQNSGGGGGGMGHQAEIYNSYKDGALHRQSQNERRQSMTSAGKPPDSTTSSPQGVLKGSYCPTSRGSQHNSSLKHSSNHADVLGSSQVLESSNLGHNPTLQKQRNRTGTSDQLGTSTDLRTQSSIAVSLPSRIDQISDEEDLQHLEHLYEQNNNFNNSNSDKCITFTPKTKSRNEVEIPQPIRKGNKLKRRKAYYNRQRTDITGRSKSLTSIDALNPMSDTMELNCKNESENGNSDRLQVPPLRCESAGPNRNCSGNYQRRRKLSTAGKVSSSEFLTVNFECFDGEKEEFMPATRGTCLREAIASVCERRGVDVESINVYLDSSTTPLPLLTTETSWLGGRLIRIKAKDENKSPSRSSERVSVTAPPSRKASAVSNSGRNKSRLFNPSSSSDDAATAMLSTSFGGIGSSNPQNSMSALNISSQASFDTSLLRVSSGSGVNNATSNQLSTKSSNKANRWSGLWGSSAKDAKMAALVHQLDIYSKIGIPKLHHNANFDYEDEVEEALYSLEEDWTDVVRNALILNERIRSQQTAIWELVETEVAFIRTLKVIQDLFLNCLCNLQSNGILTEIDTDRLFGNIPEILNANRVFWHENINPMVKMARDNGEPLDPDMMLEGFMKFEEIFSPYSRYCSEQSDCQEYCKEQDKSNDVFKAYLAWCETQKDCNRLRLLDILVRPMQRLTKYSLLLKAILKKTDDETQRNNLIIMDGKVDSFVSDVNSHLRHRQEHERLKTIIARIEAYEPVETKDDDLDRLVQNHCRLDLTSPMPNCSSNHRRHLLFEGDLKLKEGITSKVDVHAFLFSDMLLLCKNINKKQQGTDAKVKVIRPPFIIDRLIMGDVSNPNLTGIALVYLNEYKVVSSAFTLHSSENKIIKVWKEQIQKAKDLYEEAKTATARSLLAHRSSTAFYFSSYGEDEDDLSSSYCPGGGVMGAVPGGSSQLKERVRRGSFRGSRMSSIGHSYSGSVDLNLTAEGGSDVSPQLIISNNNGSTSSVRRNRSFELQGGLGLHPPNNSMATTPTSHTPHSQQVTPSSSEQRASSLSSEEGINSNFGNGKQPFEAVNANKQGSSYPCSPRGDRRPPLVKTQCSPNTLTVQIPYPQLPVQSLPDLATSPILEDADANAAGDKSAEQRRCKSPTSRGISYPPLSPKSLKRGMALQSSISLKNPPLLKSRNVEQGVQNMQIPVITGVQSELREIQDSSQVSLPEHLPQQQYQQPSHQAQRGRPERSADSRRYHTAGVIEDMKKETVRDNSIQKRLSWNYGQHIPNNELQLKNKQISKCLSSDSMRSSSGVSSTGSLHLSIGSENEDNQHPLHSKEVDSTTMSLQVGNASSQRQLSAQMSTSPTAGSAKTIKSRPAPPPVPPRNMPSLSPSQQHVSTTYITQEDVVVGNSTLPQVQISVASTNGPKNDIIKMREMLLSDNSVESSNV